MLTYSFNSQNPSVKNLPKGLPSGRIGYTYQKKVITIITVIIISTKRTPFWPNRLHVPKKKVIIIITVINKTMYLKHW